jgi:RNA polymerase sigma-70 factor (ECF subfamily)
MGAEPIPHELLLRHADFLRRLARDLVGDPSAAEDAVQDVWLRALEKPPRHGANVRGWLRVVLTNLVRSKARGESRRELREREKALGVDAELTAPGADDETTLRSVTEAVLALEEPLRSTVLQHYFQDLTTAEIATRDHLPVSTVKSRLQRALEILRTRMKRTNGDGWQASLLALTVPSKIGKGVILMSLKTKLALVGATLIAGWFLYRAWTGSPPTPPPLASSGLDAAAFQTQDSTPLPAPDSVAKSAERSAVTPVAEPRQTASSAEPTDTLLYGSILDPSGAPWRGLLYESVMIDDASGQSRRFDAQVDGTYAFHGLPFGSCWVRVEGDDLLGVEKRIELSRDQPHMKCDFTLAPAPRLKIKITTPEGENFYDALKRAREKDEAFRSLEFPFPVATLGPVEELFEEGFPQANGVNGVGWFWCWGPKVKSLPKEYAGVLSILEHGLPVRVSLVANQRVLQATTAEVGDEELRFVLSLEQFLAGAATVSLQVVDAATLTPIRGARVDLEGAARALHGWTSDANGMVLIRNHAPGEFQLRVSAPGHEDLTKVFSAAPGATTELGQIALGEEIQFEARVLDATGASCTASFKLGVLDPSTREITMEWRSSEQLDDPLRATTTWKDRSYGSDNDGMMRIRHLGRRVYVLRPVDGLRQFSQADASARWTCGNVLIDLRSGVAPKEMEIRLERGSLLVLGVKGEEVAGLRYRVFAADGLERLASVFQHSAPLSVVLPQGSYRVQLLDSGGRQLSEQTLTLDAKPRSVELSR